MSSCEIVSPGSSFSGLAKQAWNSLKGKRLISIGVFFIMIVIQCFVSYIPVVQWFAGLLLAPMNAGLLLFFLHVIRRDSDPEIANLFEPFSSYWHFVWGYLRVGIFVFLWTLLLIVPGIIAGFRYSMTFYVMLDDPRLTVKEAMAESSAIMYGHKLQLFGYGLLIALIFPAVIFCTFGIGLFWLIPWSAAFNAAFYDSIRRRGTEPAILPEAGTENGTGTEIPGA